MCGLIGRWCESLLSVSVIELPVLTNGRVATAVGFTSTISLLASREVEGSTLSAAAKRISLY